MITIWGQEVALSTIRLNITAVNEGFTVTATAVLDDDDVLYSYTESDNNCSLGYALNTLTLHATNKVNEWIANNG